MREPLFNIGNFTVVGWHILAIVLILVAVVLVIVALCLGKKKSGEEVEDDTEVEEVEDEDYADDEEVEEEQSTHVQGPKVYHIASRKDGKWQVKLGKGAKALKLFDTQKEAIAFAKEKAKNQDGRIVIHKVNGQIRKTRYDKD